MCGIFGYIGDKDTINLAIEGLKKLEYRGYDSAGLMTISEGTLVCYKEVGKVVRLEELLARHKMRAQMALAHTRWATHGKPSKENAHPHTDDGQKVGVVHNGIIENYDGLRRLLEKRGIAFRSETDTEVISQLIGLLYRGNILKTIKYALRLLKGSFAIAVIHQDHPDQIVCAAKESPLALGIGEGQMFIASDANAFRKYTKKALYLRESEVALVKAGSYELFTSKLQAMVRETQEVGVGEEEVSLGEYQHFMLKEIFEQPQTVRSALLSRYSLEEGRALLDELHLSDDDLLKVGRIVIVGCGTSYHAGLLAASMIEEYARIPVEVHISSEFRYKNPLVAENTLALAISQSGETADTLAAIRELKAKGAFVVGLCNVTTSTMAREVDSSLFLRAGPEIGVASTKAFTSQLTVLALFTLRIARIKMMSAAQGRAFIEALMQIPHQIERVLTGHKNIEALAKKYASYDHSFFIGRRYMYPTALEGALKIKEIAYINANGYPAGEMKHGPIALIDASCPTIAFCNDSVTFEKVLSNLREIKARGGLVVAIASLKSEELEKIADDLIYVPKTIDALAPIATTVVAQLFAYYVAKVRNTEIDQPRNLAKSVTVE